MRVVREIRVEGFRSLRRAAAVDLDEYVPIIGLNGTGKSNLLRALNLFFNGVVDERNTPLVLKRDFTDHLVRKKREVAVALTFDLTTGYPIRGTEKFLEDEGLSDCITVERRWNYIPDTQEQQEELRFGPDLSGLQLAGADARPSLQALIRAVDFRYIPNQARPADIIASEMQVLRPTLVKRLKQTKEYQAGRVDEALVALNKLAVGMFGPVSEKVMVGARELEAVAAAIPQDFAELAFQLGLNVMSRQSKLQPADVQGSGTQSFLLLHLLALLDSASRERGFGWRQFHIWALEEPESFLHSGLRSRFASDLRDFAAEPRRQVLLTTHDEEFMRVGQSAWLATLSEGVTALTKHTAREAISESVRLRISTFSHPLTIYPDDPIVITEGDSDLMYLSRAMVAAGLRPRWKLVAPGDIEPSQSGGANLIAYLKANRSALAARAETAPVFILKDWEVGPNDISQAIKCLEGHPSSAVIRCPVDLANPQLGQTFRGIERYLDTAIVEAVLGEERLKPASKAQTYPLGVAKPDLESAKRPLFEAFLKSAGVGAHLVSLVEWLDEEVERHISAIPAEFFAPSLPGV